MALDLNPLRAANETRVTRWHPGGVTDWSLSDWANAMHGESGEVTNAIKKWRRVEDDIANQADAEERLLNSREKARAAIGAELADTIIYLDLLALRAGLTISSAAVDHFTGMEPLIARRGAWLGACAGRVCDTVVMIELLAEAGITMTPPWAQLQRQIDETVMCCAAIARALGIELARAIADKFNATSERYGFPERLAA